MIPAATIPRTLVTGAFSNIGEAVAKELLARGHSVRTMTNRGPTPADDPRVRERCPLRFDDDSLEQALTGVDTVVSTYWIRFPFAGQTFDDAVANCARMIRAARRCRVRRFVYVSVSNAGPASRLGYYRGKAQVEQILAESGMGYGIVRPTLVVGEKDVLSSNIAWFLRRFPLIAVPTGGGYRLQPITRADTARIVADVCERNDDVTVDAAGPQVLSFREYVRVLGEGVGRRVRLVPLPPALMLASVSLVGRALGDVILTREELDGLRDEMLVSRSEPLGRESVVEWVRAHGHTFGARYVNDTVTRFGPQGR